MSQMKEMDALNDSCESDQKPVLEASKCEPKKYKNSSHTVRLFEMLQSLRKDEILCDVKLETDDGTIVIGHKVVLVSASPYFCAMLGCKFEEHDKLVKIKELDSTALQLLVDYIYTGEIVISEENVQVVLPAANIFQLDYVVEVCTEYLHTKMDVSNCLGISTFADLHNCTELMKSSEGYIKKHFLEVIKDDAFLSLSSQQVIKLISSNDIAVSCEEKVFECVIKWVQFELKCRTEFLPELMEHVRLPLLASTPEILKQVLDEPLLKNSPNCREYVNEALNVHLLKSFQHFTIPQTIRCKPRQSGGLQKVILMFSYSPKSPKCYIEWYDPTTKLRKKAPKMNHCRRDAGLGIIRDQFVFAVGGVNNSNYSKSVNILDLSLRSPCWLPMADMLVSRACSGVGVIDDCLYAVGGGCKTVEVFDASTQKWRMVASMSSTRPNFAVGVLNNCLYAVGGYNEKSVERYNPTLDTWTFIKDMSVIRAGVGVGVLNGILYAVGGRRLKSVEAFNPNTGVWSAVADMQSVRYRPGVVALDGLLYVIGGMNEDFDDLDSIEIYNPNTNTWVIEHFSRDKHSCYGGVVVDRPWTVRKKL